MESCQLITVLSSLSDHSLAQCRSGGARLPVQVVGLDIWTTTESAEVGFPVRTDWIILPWLTVHERGALRPAEPTCGISRWEKKFGRRAPQCDNGTMVWVRQHFVACFWFNFSLAVDLRPNSTRGPSKRKTPRRSMCSIRQARCT